MNRIEKSDAFGMRLSADEHQLLLNLSQHLQRTRSDTVRLLIREAAQTLSLSGAEGREACDEYIFLQYARQYVSQGFSVIPILPGEKRPATGWEQWQTQRPNDAQLIKWFRDLKVTALGVVTGQVSGGLSILDIDGDGWEIAEADLFEVFPELQYSRLVRTGSGKRHIWLLFADLSVDGMPLTRRVFRRPDLDAQIELRANRHQTLAPPSRHPNGRCYEFLNPDAPLVELPNPETLLNYLSAWAMRQRQSPGLVQPTAYFPNHNRYAAAALSNEVRNVQCAPPGTRNDTLNVAAFSLGQLVGNGLLDQSLVEFQLLEAALQTGLSQREIIATIRSGLRAGIAHPRVLPNTASSRRGNDDSQR